MSDEFLNRLIDQLEGQLEVKKKTSINIIKKKKVEPVVKDISDKLDSISQIPTEDNSSSQEPEIKKPQKVIKWL